jgi:hypothetical protein
LYREYETYSDYGSAAEAAMNKARLVELTAQMANNAMMSNNKRSDSDSDVSMAGLRDSRPGEPGYLNAPKKPHGPTAPVYGTYA